MNTGRMDGKVFVDSPDFTRDNLGEVSENFSEVAFVWREKRFLRGREADEARSQFPEASVIFEIWYSDEVSSITTDWRLREENGDKFSVIDSIPVPRGRPEKLMIYCKGRQAPETPTSDEE
jgi:head-tail adaptor